MWHMACGSLGQRWYKFSEREDQLWLFVCGNATTDRTRRNTGSVHRKNKLHATPDKVFSVDLGFHIGSGNRAGDRIAEIFL